MSKSGLILVWLVSLVSIPFANAEFVNADQIFTESTALRFPILSCIPSTLIKKIRRWIIFRVIKRYSKSHLPTDMKRMDFIVIDDEIDSYACKRRLREFIRCNIITTPLKFLIPL